MSEPTDRRAVSLILHPRELEALLDLPDELHIAELHVREETPGKGFDLEVIVEDSPLAPAPICPLTGPNAPIRRFFDVMSFDVEFLAVLRRASRRTRSTGPEEKTG